MKVPFADQPRSPARLEDELALDNENAAGNNGAQLPFAFDLAGNDASGLVISSRRSVVAGMRSRAG